MEGRQNKTRPESREVPQVRPCGPVGAPGFEPGTSSTRTMRASRTALRPEHVSLYPALTRLATTPRQNQRNIAFSDRLRNRAQPLIAALGEALHRLGVHPDAITLAGTILGGVSGVLIALGRFRAAAWVLMIGAPLDAVDGAVARAMGRKDRFGAVLDSSLDRFAEGFLFMGLSAHFARQGKIFKVALSGAALSGSFMVSYVRARVEGLGLPSIKTGLFSRFERMATWFLMLFTGKVDLGVWVMAALTNVTAVQRLIEARRLTQEELMRLSETLSPTAEEDSAHHG